MLKATKVNATSFSFILRQTIDQKRHAQHSPSTYFTVLPTQSFTFISVDLKEGGGKGRKQGKPGLQGNYKGNT